MLFRSGGRWEGHLSTGAVGGFARGGRRLKKQSEIPTVALLERPARVRIPLGLQKAAKRNTAEETAFSMIRDMWNEVEKEFEANNKHEILRVNRARDTPAAGVERPSALDRIHFVLPCHDQVRGSALSSRLHTLQPLCTHTRQTLLHRLNPLVEQ